VLDQLLHNLWTTTSEKIVLISNYTSTLDLLATLLTSLSLPFLRLDGSTPPAKRQSLVDDFNRTSAASCFAFLLSAKAGGTGLNLIGASRLVLFDVDWNPATDIQAMARIHRDGQKRHCRIYRLLLKGGLEEKIWQRQVTKIGLADSVMEQKGGVAQFSRDELRDLFRLDDGLECQTHELLGCECGGKGSGKASSVKGGIVELAKSRDSFDSETESESSAIPTDFPDVATLIKASELKARSQDARKRESAIHLPSPGANDGIPSRKGKDKMRPLMQYSHIDTSLFTASACAAPKGDSKTPIDIDSDQVDDAVSHVVESQIDDDVLLSLLKEEGNNVGFLFSRSTNLSGRAVATDKNRI
jgi:DNA repair and recombination protein RAD54B